MSAALQEVQQLYQRYVKWVSGNPSALGDVELTFKWLSYFVAGKINSSVAVSELVYSLSNLLVFFNDRIIEKANVTQHSDGGTLERQIKIMLTTLEYCEVFIELSTTKVWGQNGRWFFIAIIQTIKCLGRLALILYCRNNCIVRNPPIPTLDRKSVTKLKQRQDNVSFRSDASNGTGEVLKRSGRMLRKVNCSPSMMSRSWKPPTANELATDHLQWQQQLQPQDNGKLIKTAELLYIFKPLIHLGFARRYGMKSWVSYLVAMGLDGASLRLYFQNRQDLSKEQRVELSRRCVSLLLYLMRSPFYDRYTQARIAGLLNGIGNNVPLMGTITRLILSYIPYWQDTYFYMWST